MLKVLFAAIQRACVLAWERNDDRDNQTSHHTCHCGGTLSQSHQCLHHTAAQLKSSGLVWAGRSELGCLCRVQSDCDGLAVGFKPFNSSHCGNSRSNIFQPLPTQHLNSHLLLEGVQGDARVGLGVSVRWQSVIGAACIVPNSDRRPGPQKHAPCILNIPYPVLGILCVDDQMLWCIPARHWATRTALALGIDGTLQHVRNGYGYMCRTLFCSKSAA